MGKLRIQKKKWLFHTLLLITLLTFLTLGVPPFGQRLAHAALIANDTFTDFDRTDLDLHTSAEDGSTWTVDITGQAQIDANQLEGKTENEGRNSKDMLQDNVLAQADCQVTVSGSAFAAGVMVRMHNANTPGADGFQGKIEGSTSTARLVITKMVGGTETVLANTAADSYSLSTFYTLKLSAVNECSNTRLRLYVGGAEVLSYLETTNPMQGTLYRRAGVVIWDAKAYLDNWQSETIPAVTSITNPLDTYGFGPLEEGSTPETGLAYFMVINNGTTTVNIGIQGTDLTGTSYPWTLSNTATPGTATYGLKAGISGGSYNVTVKQTGFESLIYCLGPSANVSWGLQLLAPLTYTGSAGQNSGTVTLSASEA